MCYYQNLFVYLSYFLFLKEVIRSFFSLFLLTEIFSQALPLQIPAFGPCPLRDLAAPPADSFGVCCLIVDAAEAHWFTVLPDVAGGDSCLGGNESAICRCFVFVALREASE